MELTDLAQEQAEAILARWLGRDVKCIEIKRLYGGMINSVLGLSFDQEPYKAVIKIRPYGDSDFADEARRLEYLQDNTNFPCPKVYYEDSSPGYVPFAFLLLEMLPGVSMASTNLSSEDKTAIDLEMAGILIELHSNKRETFGDPYEDIGCQNWADIFVPRLMDVQREMEGILPVEVLNHIDYAVEIAEEVMKAQGEPTLIHGDIWSGNILVAPDDYGWHISGIVDPGTQYADVEMELAYLEVFNTVGPEFLQAYTSHFPLRPDYEFRRLFYWLNTYMIHVWHFGDEHYHRMTERIASAIANWER